MNTIIKVVPATTVTTSEGLVDIVTHSGVFHADEVIGTAIVAMDSPNTEINIVRTRNPKAVATLTADDSTYVLDIGGVCEEAKGNFDHHQKEGVRTYSDGTMYATAGLVWEQCGRDVLNGVYIPFGYETAVFNEIKDQLKLVDNHDNGETEEVSTLSVCISNFNPSLVAEDTSDSRFVEAVEFAIRQLQLMIELAISHAEAATRVHAAYEARTGGVIVLEEFVPWKEHLAEMDVDSEVLYVVYKDIASGWRVSAVPLEVGKFGDRLSLPNEWRGLGGEALQQASGVKDATFCHKGGFIGGTATEEGAIAMARRAIALQQ